MPIDKQLTVGMSGHIDHGKTSIVKLLTGTNTDTLKQEQDRGMTIDIGFAFLNKNITIVDVPGHEKFVKNMMSGTSGIDLAVLVIAADDGIMPQTIEHFEILKLLNIKYGFIALNKVDLVEEEWIDLVENDIKTLIKGSFLDNTKIIRTSTHTKEGLEELSNYINEMYKIIPRRKTSGIFRMHIDRVFNKIGFGVVVTGTVSSGTISKGETVELLPAKQKVKIRNIQSHGRNVNEVFSGERAAININNIDLDNVKRGSHLSKLNTYMEINSFLAELTLNQSKKINLKSEQRVRVHLGTREVMARISILKLKKNQETTRIPVLIKLESSIIGGIGDYFIIRSYSPVYTIGGGVILEIETNTKWKTFKQSIENLFLSSKEENLYNIIDSMAANSLLELEQIESRLNISLDEMIDIVKIDRRYKIVKYRTFNWLLSKNNVNRIKKSIIEQLEEYHKEHPMKLGCNKGTLIQKTLIDENILMYFLDELNRENKVNNKSELWSLESFTIETNTELQSKKNSILSYINKNDFLEINEKLIVQDLKLSTSDFYQVIEILERNKEVIKLGKDLFVSCDRLDRIKNNLTQEISKKGEFSVPEFKNIEKITRKLAIPILEYLDKINFTYRIENKRKLV